MSRKELGLCAESNLARDYGGADSVTMMRAWCTALSY